MRKLIKVWVRSEKKIEEAIINGVKVEVEVLDSGF